jgi:AbrB family looped-hinge helix DNA binding protein
MTLTGKSKESDMRITSKGQVTIPQEIRERAGLLPHTEVEFVYDGKTVQIIPAKGKKMSRGAKLVEHMRGRGTIKLTTDEIMAMTRR